MRLEDVRHFLSRVTFACLCKFVERPAQPLFELFSLGSPLGSGSCLLFHFSLVTLYQRQRSADGFLRSSQAWFGEPKLSYHGMGTRVYSSVEPRYHVQARRGRVSFSCPFWAWWCKVLTVKCLCPRAIHSLSSYGHKCTVDRHGQDTMRTESQPLLCCWRYCCGVVALS